jgi:16S rRNA (cytidine1402-2'-O)-methyltransferase
VDVVLCEDTRVTRKLLDAYEIQTDTRSYHAHSSFGEAERILELFQEGKNVALVSDAGTPTISDPGVLLVGQVREKFGDAVEIVSVPGPSALVSALSVSGISSAQFIFLGFLPHKKGRDTLFKEIADAKRTVVFYESPHRIMKTLERLKENLVERQVVVAREMTKIHEEVVKGTAEEVWQRFVDNPDTVRGEFVVIVEGAR